MKAILLKILFGFLGEWFQAMYERFRSARMDDPRLWEKAKAVWLEAETKYTGEDRTNQKITYFGSEMVDYAERIGIDLYKSTLWSLRQMVHDFMETRR